MRVYGFSRLMLLRHVYIPGAFPTFLSGARSVFGLCWKVVAAGEVLALPRFGAGQLLYSAKVHLETTEVFAVTVILIVICFALEGAFSLFIKIKSGGGSPPRVPAAAHAPSFTAPPAGTPRNAPSSSAHERLFLNVHNLSVTRGQKEIYRAFSARFEQGAVTALIAASGRGKTTLLDCIAGILPPQSGSVSLCGADGKTADTAFRVSYLFQDDQLLPWRAVEQNVALPLRQPDALQKARGFLQKTGLAARQAAFPRELSGGERQRAALARAFCFAAPVLLMDEAFQSLDLPLKLGLMNLTQTLLAEESRAVIFVTHDVREALCLADRILVLAGEPLAVTRDITVPPARGAIADIYVHLPQTLLALEEDILDALSRDQTSHIRA
jgi:ABC-type nitrate/sulfonate/bicarbonate transport system ATPase subunit